MTAPMKPGWRWIFLVAAASAIAMIVQSGRGDRLGVALAAMCFGFMMLSAAVGLIVDARRKAQGPIAPLHAASAFVASTRLAGLAYGWAGITMAAIYHLSPLRWQHGWQYGLVMALAALGNLIYARRLETDADRTGPASVASLALVVRLAAVQGVAICGGLMWLVGSGKLLTAKQDWAANDVFLAAGLAVIAASAAGVISHRLLANRN